jgi:hypothetical protein
VSRGVTDLNVRSPQCAAPISPAGTVATKDGTHIFSFNDALLLGAIPPHMLKTDTSPDGVPIEALCAALGEAHQRCDAEGASRRLPRPGDHHKQEFTADLLASVNA